MMAYLSLPDLSAAPPCMTRAINIRPVPSSALIVAPYTQKVISLKIIIFLFEGHNENYKRIKSRFPYRRQ